MFIGEAIQVCDNLNPNYMANDSDADTCTGNDFTAADFIEED